MLALFGVIAGLVGAFGITRVIRSLLYNVTPTDPLSFGGVTLFIAGIAVLASYLPARRATNVAMTALVSQTVTSGYRINDPAMGAKVAFVNPITARPYGADDPAGLITGSSSAARCRGKRVRCRFRQWPHPAPGN